ncbi:MAG: GDSL-type esterase/lipase family protein [Agathobacter sp.]|nr:GDSL-type esterase/lipase family protein [Agathobacter sp.]
MNKTNNKWVSIWGNAMSISENKPEGYGKNITLCYKVKSPFSGDSLRLTFDNYCGTEEIEIESVTILLNHNFYPVSFNTNHTSNISIPAKESVVSNPIDISITDKDSFEVRFYLKDYTQLRSSVYASGPLSEGLYAVGNYTNTEEISIDVSRKTNIFYFLSNISLHTNENNRCIVCYGDSITAQDWPDYLSLRCMAENFNQTSIIRRATSGSRILREYSCITYESYGLMGKNRFEHEVPTDGADTIIIQQGINDIIHPVGIDVNPFRPMGDLPTVEELIEGLKWYIDKARSYGYKIYVGTLLPIEGWRTYEDFRETLRTEYNNWIRQTDLIDGVIDFDKALCDSNNPTAFLPTYDSGDHLHPSTKGYQKMASIVPSKILK